MKRLILMLLFIICSLSISAVSGLSVPLGQTLELTAAQTMDVDSVDYWGSLRITKSHIGNNPGAVGLTYQFGGGYFALTPEPYRPPHSVAVGARYVPSFHYYVNDYQGNVRLVVDGNGTVEQRNDYYAYGGPWGDNAASQGVQPNKYNGKELDRMHGLDWYDYGARMYDPAMGLFTQIDPLCEQYPHLNPYQYCAGNPVKYVDPDGKDVVISGPLAHMAVQQLQAIIGNKVQLNLSDDNHLCYNIVRKGLLNKHNKRLIKMIDNCDITVNMTATDKNTTSTGALFVGGAFMGNNIDLDASGNVVRTTAFQEVNPLVLDKADTYSTKGTFIMHELTEAFEGAIISAKAKVSSPNSKSPYSVYKKAHKKATYQPPVYSRYYDKDGNILQIEKGCVKAEWYVKPYKESADETIIQTLP